jgi:Ner family transcriptional regulator
MDTKFIDWHTADIIAALRKKGTSLAAESRRHGLSSSTLANALTRPWPKGELIIATALDTHPWVIWPSRYHDPITHEFIDRTRMIRQRKVKRIAGITFFDRNSNPRSFLAGGCRNDYSPFTRSILAPSARSLSSIRS